MKALIEQVRVELMIFLRDKAVVTFSLFFPILTVAFFGYLNRGGAVGDVSYGSFLVAGGVGMVVTSAAFENLGITLARQRDSGILKRLGGTPLRTWILVAAKILAAALVILVQTIVMIALNVLLFGAKLSGSTPWSVAALVLGIFSFATMGIALAGISRNVDVAGAAARAISFPMQFLCGTLFPVDSMPPFLRGIAQALPLTYFVDALRGAMLSGGGVLEYSKDWIVLLICLVGAFGIALISFRWE